MRISQAHPSTYLKASDLQGQEVDVMMNRVVMEEVGGDPKPVLYFQGKDKGLVLNITNSNTIAAMYGDETNEWLGCAITLGTAYVDFQGRQVEAIRVRPIRPAVQTSRPAQAPALSSENPAEPRAGVDLDDSIPFGPERRV